MQRRPKPEALRRAVRAAVEAAAADLPPGAPTHIDRLTLRMPSSAGSKDVARALGGAIRAQTRTGGGGGT
ncbi:hypothetical protein [Aliiroseovarius sp. YM-037]|uniref:hypothetical protein n=1 Tax=Aliiroseovarius sp. YM-037 TaxID=3341728 RepID=UPI003A7FCE52